MWSIVIGTLLILAGLAVALCPIFYGLHRDAVARNEREMHSQLVLEAEVPTARCSKCGEMIEEDFHRMSVPSGGDRQLLVEAS